jgi:peptidoglycan/LPS O-acetylase OafA/YrhL
MSAIASINLLRAAEEPRAHTRGGLVTGTKRIAALDGLRGLAVILVFLIHATIITPRSLPGTVLVSATFLNGFGPFLFFGLSAYLITSILRRRVGKPGYYRRIYLSRGLRILPVYYLFIAGTLLVLPRVISEHYLEFSQTYHADWAYWIFLQNFIVGFHGAPQHKMLDVSWTLAVDFQFFLVWPVAVRYLSRDWLVWLCGAMVALALVTRTYLVFFTSLPHDAPYYFTPARLDAFGFGALVALLGDNPRTLLRLRPYAKVIAACIVPVIWTYLRIEHRLGLSFNPSVIQSAGYFSRTLGDTIASLGAACLILCCVTGTPASLSTRVFSARPMTFLGTRAYGFFLMHLPVIWLVRTSFFGPDDPTGTIQPLFAMVPVLNTFVPDQLLFYAICFPIAVVLASLSYALVERPIIEYKNRLLARP